MLWPVAAREGGRARIASQLLEAPALRRTRRRSYFVQQFDVELKLNSQYCYDL